MDPQSLGPQPQSSIPPKSAPPTGSFNPNDIYPSATQTPATNTVNTNQGTHLANNYSQANNSLTFKDGFKWGGGIFWRQLAWSIVLGIVISLIVRSMVSSLSNTGSLSSYSIVFNILNFAFALFILVFVPKRYLDSQGASTPVWLAVFTACLELTSLILVSTILTIWVLTDVSGIFGLFGWLYDRAGAGTILIEWLFSLIATIAFIYLMTKVYFGLGTMIFGKENNDRKIKVLTIAAIGITIIVDVACSLGVKQYANHRYQQLINSQQGTSSSILTNYDYDNNRGNQFNLSFYQGSTEKPLSTSTDGTKELVAPDYKEGKAPLTMFITASALNATTQPSYDKFKDCSNSPLVLSAYNSNVDQIINACKIVDPQNQSLDLLYICVFTYQNKLYVVNFGQDVDWSKTFSSTSNVKATLAANGLSVYNADITRILRSIKPLN